MLKKISVIILNWNEPKYSVNCVIEIILVDNYSNDNSIEIFKREFRNNKDVRIIKTFKNMGSAGGNNIGVLHSVGEYIIILNNDTITQKSWLSELVNALESDSNVAAVSSFEIRPNDPLAEINWKTEGITRTLVWYPIKYKRKKPIDNIDTCFMIPIKGCSFIYKKDLLDLPFDSEYFIYAEDDYLAWLFTIKGYKNMIANKSIVHHFHNTAKKSSKKMNTYFIFLGERNRIMNLFIFYEKKTIYKIMPLLLINIFFVNLIEFRKIKLRIRAYKWLFCNFSNIKNKRARIQEQRIVNDKEIIKKLSCKLREETVCTNIIMRRMISFINFIFCIYCKAVGLNTIENEK
jgi:GT2 family glycosyltransferase